MWFYAVHGATSNNTYCLGYLKNLIFVTKLGMQNLNGDLHTHSIPSNIINVEYLRTRVGANNFLHLSLHKTICRLGCLVFQFNFINSNSSVFL